MTVQVSCFVKDSDGHKYMADYDRLPFDARKRLQNSKYNLCSACVIKLAYALNNPHIAITYMEGVLDGRDMRRYIDKALYEAMYQQDGRGLPRTSLGTSSYIPEYWDDREIDFKVKRDWYTQRMELKNYEYLRMPGIIKSTDYF